MNSNFPKNPSRAISRIKKTLFFVIAVFVFALQSKAVVITIPTTPGTDTTSLMPTNRKTTFSATRMLFKYSEIGATGTVTELGFQKASGSTATSVNYITIYMKETTATSVSKTVPSLTGYTKVYNSGAIDNTMSSGWTTITLSTALGDIFTYSGGSNNLDIIIIKTTSETATTSFPVYNHHYTATTDTLAAYYFGSSILSTTFTANTIRRPNIKVTIANSCSGKPSAGTVSGPTTSVCSGNNFTLTGTGITLGFGMQYQWQSRNAGSGSFVNTSSIDTNTTLTTNITASKDFRIISKCTLSGQSDTSSLLTVNVLSAPIIAAATDTTFCSGGSVSLSTTSVSGITFNWYKGVTNTGATGATYSATTSGTYTVRAITTACPSGLPSNGILVTVNPLPTATITPSGVTTFCSGLSVTLQANTGTSLSYQWQKGAVDISGATSSSYVANTSGNYRVKVTNTVTGCSDFSAVQAVTVNPSPIAPIISGAGGDTAFCKGNNLVLSTIPTSGISYQWENLSGIITGATTNSYTATNAGTYRLAAILGSCTTKSNSLVIVENLLPTAAFTPTGTISFCNGDSLLATATTSTDVSYQWLESSVAISGATSSTFYIKTAGVYAVKVTNSTTGCKDQSASLTVNVITTTVPTISASGVTKFCNGDTVKLNAVVATGLISQWQKGGIDIPGEVGPTLVVTTSGTYRMKVTNSVGCSDYSTPIVVSVNPIPDNTVAITGGTSICDGESTILTAPIIPGYTYQWLNAGVDIVGATLNPYYAKTTGSFSVKIIDSNGCQATSTDIGVTVKFVKSFFIQPYGNTFFCDGEQTKLATQSGFTAYQWYYNGVFIPGATDTFVYATKNGKYSVQVQDPTNGCFGTSAGFNIIVIPSPDTPYITKVGSRLSTSVKGVYYQWYKDTIAIPGATDSFINIGTSVGVYSVKVTNIRDCSKTAYIDLNPTSIVANVSQTYYIKLYPNPTSDKLNIEAPEGLSVRLSDMQGRLLYTGDNVKQIDMNSYADGIYIIQFVDAQNQIVGVEKVAKRTN